MSQGQRGQTAEPIPARQAVKLMRKTDVSQQSGSAQSGFAVKDTSLKTIALCLGFCILGACTTVPVGERAGKRDQIDQTATRTVAEVIAKDSSLQAEMDAAVGYFAGSVSSVSALIVGGGVGFGVLVDNQYDTRTYMNIQRLDLGAGLGARP
jgi:hypothetical protein